MATAQLLLAAPPARAEWRVETTISAPPVLKPRVVPPRPARTQPPIEDAEPDLAVQPAATGADEGESEESQDARAPAAPMPTAARDADLLEAPDRAPQDGIIVVGEPTAVQDGIPDMHRDPRSAEEIQAFALPQAELNPYLFTIEPEPLADRRTAQLFLIEPYFARGTRIGSFVLFPEAQIGGILTNNIFREPAKTGDGALEVGGNARLVSDWRAHAVEFRATGLASFYDRHPTEDDRFYALEARGRLDISRRTNIEALVLHQADKDRRGQRDSPGAAAARGDVELDRIAVALNHRFNRLALQARGTFSHIDFAPVADTSGGTITNAERDTTQAEAAFRASWALNAKFDVFAEVAANERRYEAAPDDGILRSSSGERYRLGVVFSPQGSTIRGEVSVGWGRQVPKDDQLGGVEGFLVDANLAWRATPLTTFLLTASTDFTDTTTTGSAGALSRQVGLEARHALRRHLIGTAGIKYTVNPYDGVAIDERYLTTEVGLEYYMGRDVILYARYQHVDFESSVPGSDYDADIARIGMRVRR